MTNYRRFERRRLLSVQVSGFHSASFPVAVKYFQVPKAKTGAAKAFSLVNGMEPCKHLRRWHAQ